MSTTVASCDRILVAAKRAGTVFVVPEQAHYWPDVQPHPNIHWVSCARRWRSIARRKADSGKKCGEPVVLLAQRLFVWPQVPAKVRLLCNIEFCFSFTETQNSMFQQSIIIVVLTE